MAPSIRCAASCRALRSAFATSSTREVTLPSFLVPAFALPSQSQHRQFSASSACQSKVGSAPLSLPPQVTLQVVYPPEVRSARAVSREQQSPTVHIEGPLGKLSLAIPPFVNITLDEERNAHVVSILDTNDKKQKAMWGTVRAYLNNHILGVSEGHSAILRLNGVGYRASIESSAVTASPAYDGQKFVSLKVGYSHPIELGVPVGVTASCPQPTRILLQGAEKEVVKQFAAEIRAWRVPEPYKGKGIFVNDETIRLKAKKIK